MIQVHAPGTAKAQQPASNGGDFDVAVIGGGPGGYVAAIRAAQLGARVALIEKERIGGVCLNVGCIPTKALAATAEALANAGPAGALGVSVRAELDWRRAQAHKDAVVGQMVAAVSDLLRAHGVEVIAGHGRLLDGRTVAVESEGSTGRLQVARGVILAPGSAPAPATLAGADLPGVVDSSGALGLQAVPGRLAVVGGGVVGAELASIYAGLGSSVTLLEYLPALLPGMDADVGRRLQLAFRRSGVAVHTRSRVDSIVRGAPLRIEATGPHGAFAVETDVVLLAMGRRPAIDGLGLAQAGVRVEGGAIWVDAHLQTNLPGVYAVGDATGGLLLAHRAMAQGRLAAENLLGAERELDEMAIPACVFTRPEVATVGLSLPEARKRGMAAEEVAFPFSSNGRALATGEALGEARIVCAPAAGRVLGMHIVGPHATDLIAEGALAVRLGLSAADLADTVHAHPTYGEAVMEAALGCRGSMIHHRYGAAPDRRAHDSG